MGRNAVRVCVALLLAGGMLFYVERILIPYQVRDAAAHNRPRGNLSDLYPRWLGARELLLHGRDPYSNEITTEIQAGFYGRPLDTARPDDPKDQQRFAYPVYVAFVLAPFVTLPFDIVQPVFLWLLVLLTAVSVLLWLSFLQWRPSLPITSAVLLLTVGSFAVVQGVKLQQLTLLVGFLVAVVAASLVRGRFLIAGVFMGIAMIKPQLVVPVAGWFLMWTIFDWRHRRGYALGFVGTFGVLLAASQGILPGWAARFREAVSAYRTYAVEGGVLETLFSPLVGNVLKVVLIAVVIALCWRLRRASETSSEFAAITGLVLAATVIILPMIVPYNQVLLLPSILWFVREGSQIWTRGPIAKVATGAAVLMIGWPWFAAALLMGLGLFIPVERLQQAWAVPLFSSLFIPLAVIALHFIAIQNPETEDQRTT